MVEDSETRFRKVMDKLGRSPRPEPSPASGVAVGLLQKGKRMDPSSSSGAGHFPRQLMVGIGKKGVASHPCRPWDRGDLMRRLATFKAMTWFGKPKAIGPVNCAKRGWINVEMDVIACEACGSRLLFSSPSSWTYHQVEKAAAVLSLKLNSGHKPLCPWKDNICDESMTLFPPTPAQVLVDAYRERATSLSRLTALPIISLSALDSIKIPQLESFLKESSTSTWVLGNGIKLIENSNSEKSEFLSEDSSACLYFQALKIISLCGWELRILPYTVESEESNWCLEKAFSGSLRPICSDKDHALFTHPSSNPVDLEGDKNDQRPIKYQSDPSSAVLDCKICGACVGLWAFKSISRPLECFTLIDSPGANGLSDPDNLRSGVDGMNNTINSGERPLGLNLTIAGGILPTEQNFRPRVSLPIISRRLRAEFGSNHDARIHIPSNVVKTIEISECQQSTDGSLHQQNENADANLAASTETREAVKRKRNEDDQYDIINFIDFDLDDQQINRILQSEETLSCIEDTSTHFFEDGHSKNHEHTFSGDNDFINHLHNGEDASCENGIPQGTISAISEAREVRNNNATSDHFETVSISEADMIPTFTDSATAAHTSSKCMNEGENQLDSTNLPDPDSYDDNTDRVKVALNSDSSQSVASDASGRSLMLLNCTGEKGFDPVRQHRNFCPWVAGNDGEGVPGWKLTLFALDQHTASSGSIKEYSLRHSDDGDDPIVSVRKLFLSPASKRSRGST